MAEDDVRAEGRPVLRGWLHAVALPVTVVAGTVLLMSARGTGDTLALSVYVASLVALFGVSAGFHRIRWTPAARRRMRRVDHATIFVAIAGTYTAVSWLSLRGWARVVILGVVWGGAALGIMVRELWLEAPKWAVAVPYVAVGWSAVLVVPQLVVGLGVAGFCLLVAGGVAYTGGAVVYALRRPDPAPRIFGYHEVFHALTIVGTALDFLAVAAFALPRG